MILASKLLVEFIGAFILMSVVLFVGEPIPVAAALLVSIYIAGKISGGHINPAVSFAFFVDGKLGGPELLGYMSAQILGALTAVGVYKLQSI